ncbi:hypothetical protein V7138_15920 [Bacillus sp. JJ1533]
MREGAAVGGTVPSEEAAATKDIVITGEVVVKEGIVTLEEAAAEDINITQ